MAMDNPPFMDDFHFPGYRPPFSAGISKLATFDDTGVFHSYPINHFTPMIIPSIMIDQY
jgi:hypothetical protein